MNIDASLLDNSDEEKQLADSEISSFIKENRNSDTTKKTKTDFVIRTHGARGKERQLIWLKCMPWFRITSQPKHPATGVSPKIDFRFIYSTPCNGSITVNRFQVYLAPSLVWFKMTL